MESENICFLLDIWQIINQISKWCLDPLIGAAEQTSHLFTLCSQKVSIIPLVHCLWKQCSCRSVMWRWCKQTVMTASYMPHIVKICYCSQSPCLDSLCPVISVLLLNLQTLHMALLWFKSTAHRDKAVVEQLLTVLQHVVKYYYCVHSTSAMCTCK